MHTLTAAPNPRPRAADTDAGWSDIILSPALRVDLLNLRKGVLATLGATITTPFSVP